MFSELRQLRSLADFAAAAQLVVLYEKAGRRTRASSNESEGYLTVNEALDVLGPDVVEKHAASHAWYRRLNGYDETINYAAEVAGGGAWSPDDAWLAVIF